MWNSARKLRPNHIVINPNLRSKRTLIKQMPEIQQCNGIDPPGRSSKATTVESNNDTSTNNDSRSSSVATKISVSPFEIEEDQHVVNLQQTEEPEKAYTVPEKRYLQQDSDLSMQHSFDEDDGGCNEVKYISYYEEVSTFTKRIYRGHHSETRKLPVVPSSLLPQSSSVLYNSGNFCPERQNFPVKDYRARKKRLTRRLLPIPPQQLLSNS